MTDRNKPPSPRRRYAAATFVLSPVIVMLVACERSGDSDPAVRSRQANQIQQTKSLTPGDTVRTVRALRNDGRMAELERYLMPSQRRSVVELVHAIDQLVVANDTLQARVTAQYGSAFAAAFDRSEAVNAVGVFSRDVAVIDEKIDGDRAIVSIQVAERVPLVQVALTRKDARWLILTDPPIPGVAEQIRDLADALLRCGDRAGTVAASQLHGELLTTEKRIGRRLAELTQPAVAHRPIAGNQD